MRRILWFRRDLRVNDNPLLSFGGEVLPIFIFDINILKQLPKNDRRVSLIFDAVVRLKSDLESIGLNLKIYHGDPLKIFETLCRDQFDEVIASGDYDSYAKERDKKVSMLLPLRLVQDTYIYKPDEILKEDATPYLVFTPFYKRCKAIFNASHLQQFKHAEHTLLGANYHTITHQKENLSSDTKIDIDSIGFEYTTSSFVPVADRLKHLCDILPYYKERRDYPDLNGTSSLSVALRFGLIGIRELLRFLVTQKKSGVDTEPFFRELIFREFYAYLLYHFPKLEKENFKYDFKGIENQIYYQAFCSGNVGVPLVDAGIRQLLQTGEMHNRIRMVCASFFCKDLLLPWEWGEAFFARHLLDYDVASNLLSWQWSSGTGVDPQPYFRIFNPWLQAQKFDSEGLYIKRWIPQLHSLSPKQLHNESDMFSHTIEDYPHPIVSHQEASKKALAYYQLMLHTQTNTST